MSALKTHECTLLKYRDRYMALCETTSGNRWRLISKIHPTDKSDNDLVILDDIVFCPGCGKDFRLSTTYTAPGRPQLQAILKRIRAEARKAER